MRAAGNLVLVGAREPVAFFAYPDKPSLLMPENARSTELAGIEEDMEAALEALAMELDATGATPAGIAAPRRPAFQPAQLHRPQLPPFSEPRRPRMRSSWTKASPRAGSSSPRPPAPHRTTGSTTGAAPSATACRSRSEPPSPAPTARSSRSWATAAPCTRCRHCGPWPERACDITVLIFANGTYNILRGELTNVGVRNPGPRAVDMLSIGRPDLDWVSLARGMGVEASRTKTCEQLSKALGAGLRSEGPYSIEVAV